MIMGPPWRPAVPKMASKFVQIVPKRSAAHVALGLFRDHRTNLLPKFASEHSWAPFWWSLGAHWHQNRRFSDDLSSHVDEILDINLGHRFARRPKLACCFIKFLLQKNLQRTNDAVLRPLAAFNNISTITLQGLSCYLQLKIVLVVLLLFVCFVVAYNLVFRFITGKGASSVLTPFFRCIVEDCSSE